MIDAAALQGWEVDLEKGDRPRRWAAERESDATTSEIQGWLRYPQVARLR